MNFIWSHERPIIEGQYLMKYRDIKTQNKIITRVILKKLRGGFNVTYPVFNGHSISLSKLNKNTVWLKIDNSDRINDHTELISAIHKQEIPHSLRW